MKRAKHIGLFIIAMPLALVFSLVLMAEAEEMHNPFGLWWEISGSLIGDRN